MKFKIDDTFKHYWPPLPEEKRIILEKSILEEGLRDNLIVWKEKNILLDGHQRLSILTKHGIPFDNKITLLSFPDEVHAKHWVHVTQAARRGDAPQFLSICHVLEFEPIYKAEADKRAKAGTPCANGTGGLSRFFMARDSAASEHSIQRVLYIKLHDPERFKRLYELSRGGGEYEHGGGLGRGKDTDDVSIHLEHSKVKAIKDAEKAGVEINAEALELFTSSNVVRDFVDTVIKYEPPLEVQKVAAEAIVANNATADKNYVEDAVVHRMPKKRERKKDKPALTQLSESMEKIASSLYAAINETKRLQELRQNPSFGDVLYFRALADATNLRAAFAEWVVFGKLMNEKGDSNGKKKLEESRLLCS